MRNFFLYRTEDETGISGNGIVAEGVEFLNKKCVLCWSNRLGSIGIYDNIGEVIAIHGHAGKTKIIWRDYEAAIRTAKSTVNNFWEFGLEAEFEKRICYLEDAINKLNELK